MARLAQEAHVGRQVAGADEHAIDARHVGDLFQVAQRLAGFDLHQHAGFLGRPRVVVLDPAEARRPRGRREAAHSVRRVARRGDRLTGLLRVLHIRDQEGLNARIQVALDRHHVVPRRPHDRVRRSADRRLKLAVDHRQVVRRMLGVDQQPVEPGPGQDLDRDVARQARPEADLLAAFLDRPLERVDRHVHGASFPYALISSLMSFSGFPARRSPPPWLRFPGT